jgi:Fe-S cluster assembly scaffold protein SufB
LNFLNTDKINLDLSSHLVGEEAESNINLVFYGKSAQKMNLVAGNIFDARSCKGQILAKGVVADKSKVGFIGKIEITLAGGGTDSYLKEEVLMLDETAKIDAIPMLEIKTNDVKAGHGVSISKLTEDKIFYLTSRGIDSETARKLVLEGFLRELYSKCEESEVIELLEQEVN